MKNGDYFGPHGPGEMRGYPVRVEATEAARDRDAAARLRSLSVGRTGVDFDSGPAITPV